MHDTLKAPLIRGQLQKVNDSPAEKANLHCEQCEYWKHLDLPELGVTIFDCIFKVNNKSVSQFHLVDLIDMLHGCTISL